MKTSQRIKQYLAKNQQASGRELADYLGITDRAVRKQLAELLLKKQVMKKGGPPKVFYQLAAVPDNLFTAKLNLKQAQIINDNYLIITPSGEKMAGVAGFAYWCVKTKQPVEKTAREYIRILAQYNRFRRNGLINGMEKLKQTFAAVYLDKLYYLDFYSLERFGKTKLGQLLLYAKQSQDKEMIRELTIRVKNQIKSVIKKHHITSVGFIPPTVKRQVQLMEELKKNLDLDRRTVNLIKIKTPVIVPQKTLTKLADRMENARHTIIVAEKGKHDNILLIDDAVGSGATLNETAGQIRAKKICRGKIFGLAITGSFKGFDVISEV